MQRSSWSGRGKQTSDTNEEKGLALETQLNLHQCKQAATNGACCFDTEPKAQSGPCEL